MVFAVAVLLAIASFFLIKGNRLRPEHYPLAFGIGGIVGALILVATPLLTRSELPTMSKLFWAVSFGAAVYLSGRLLARRVGKR